MAEIRRQVTADRDALWRVISDVRRWPDWLPTVDAVTALDPDRPDEVGASYVVEQPKLPTATWTITDWRVGESFTWESRVAGLRSTGVHELLPRPDGSTEVVLGVHWAGPLARLVGLAYGRLAQRYVETEAQALETTARAGL